MVTKHLEFEEPADGGFASGYEIRDTVARRYSALDFSTSSSSVSPSPGPDGITSSPSSTFMGSVNRGWPQGTRPTMRPLGTAAMACERTSGARWLITGWP